MSVGDEVLSLYGLVNGYRVMSKKEDLPAAQRAIYASASDYIKKIAVRLQVISISQSAVHNGNRYIIALDVFKEFNHRTGRGIMPNDFTKWLDSKQKT